MSRSARTTRRRIQPYAWLGAGVVTLGLGAGLVSGTAVAGADTGTGSADGMDGRAPAAASDTLATSPARVTPTPAKKNTRGGRGAPLPASAASVHAGDAGAVVNPRGSVLRRGARPAAAAVPLPAADPAPNMDSWLPTTPIVPGEHVTMALAEIATASQVLQAQTWGSGNVLAGLASIVPQVFLYSGAASLGFWQATNPGAQEFLANTAGIPIIAQVAQLNLVVNMWLPAISTTSLDAAALFLPVVGLFGAPAAVAATGPIISAARANGLVYAVVPLQVKAGTQPVANVSINNGPRVPLLVDTGASGVVVLPSAVPNVETLTPVGNGDSCFSGGLCYHYETYRTTVDFGGGAVTDSGLVNVVTNNDEYPNSVQTFTNYFSWGADGIMGVGANTAGPGPAPIANATLPGELSDGVLIWQNLLPFGLGGLLVFGLNPLPTRVSLPGAPDAYVKVSVNGAPQTTAGAIIDSGGVYGTLPLANAPAGSVAGQDLPAGTVISVYSADGGTLLYTFTTLSGDRATPVIASGLMNTGNAPYAQNPVYMNYAGPGGGIGSTDFSIW